MQHTQKKIEANECSTCEWAISLLLLLLLLAQRIQQSDLLRGMHFLTYNSCFFAKLCHPVHQPLHKLSLLLLLFRLILVFACDWLVPLLSLSFLMLTFSFCFCLKKIVMSPVSFPSCRSLAYDILDKYTNCYCCRRRCWRCNDHYLPEEEKRIGTAKYCTFSIQIDLNGYWQNSLRIKYMLCTQQSYIRNLSE